MPILHQRTLQYTHIADINFPAHDLTKYKGFLLLTRYFYLLYIFVKVSIKITVTLQWLPEL